MDDKLNDMHPINETATDLMTSEEAAAFLKISRRTLEGWRYKGTGPEFDQLGYRLIRYKRSTLIAWSDKEAAKFRQARKLKK